MLKKNGWKVKTFLIYIHWLSKKTTGMSAFWCKNIGKKGGPSDILKPSFYFWLEIEWSRTGKAIMCYVVFKFEPVAVLYISVGTGLRPVSKCFKMPKTIQIQIRLCLFTKAFNMYGLYYYVQEYHFPVKCNLSNSFYDERCYFSECTQFDMFVGVSIIENHLRDDF